MKLKQLKFSAPEKVEKKIETTKPEFQSMSGHILGIVEAGLKKKFPKAK